MLLSFGRRFSRLIHAELPQDSPGDIRGLEKHPCLWLPWMCCPLPPPAFVPPGRTSSLRAMFQDQEAPLRPHGPILGSEPAPAPRGQPWLSQEHGYQGGAGLGLPDWGAAGLKARTQLWTVIDLLQPAESGDTPGGPPWATWRGVLGGESDIRIGIGERDRKGTLRGQEGPLGRHDEASRCVACG